MLLNRVRLKPQQGRALFIMVGRFVEQGEGDRAEGDNCREGARSTINTFTLSKGIVA
jgi:hypothetical protein